MSEKKHKILLIDDDQFLLDIYSTKFKEEGFDIEIALGGEEALEKVRDEGDFTIVLFDLVMPGVDGFQLLTTIRKEKLLENAVFIILSNQGQQTDIDHAKDLHVDGYIVKASTIPSEVVKEVIAIADKKG